MSLSSFTAGPDLLPSTRLSRRPASRNGFYRAVAIITTFAMLFGGLLLMPQHAAAASAVTTARLNLRSGPGLEFDVIGVIPSGAAISVDGDAEAGYYPVTYNSSSGYAAADFIQIGGTPDPEPEPEPAPGDSGTVPVGDTATGTARVSANLNLRQGPGASYAVIVVMQAGATVELRGDAQSGYYPLSYNGRTGWAAADWLDIGGGDPAPAPTPPPGDSGTVPVGDTATGTGTTTANLNLRRGPGTTYAAITVMPSGSAVELRGEAQNGFYPLSFNGTTGWASTQWISVGAAPAPTPSPTPAPGGNGAVPVGDSATGSATVTANLNLRQGPGTTYAVVTVMQAGATVELRGEAQNGFYPLSYNGTTGWAAADWLNVGTAPAPTPSPTPAPGGDGSVPVGDTVTGTATVTEALNLRSGPGTTYAVRAVMPAGASVELRGEAQNGFYPLNYNGTTGWASGTWLSIGSDPAPTPEPTPTPSPGDGSVPVGDTVTGQATTTASLNLRRGPGTTYAVVTVMPSGAAVELRGEPQNGFYPLGYGGTTGWAAGDWLRIGGTDPGPDPTPDPGSGNHPQYLYTQSAVNMRSQPTTDSSVVWVIPPGTRVTITGPLQNGWYPTAWAHVSGYMHSDFLVASLEQDYPPDKQWIVDIIYAAADRYGQPREDMLRVAQCESHLDPNAVNMDHANDTDRASGLFQFRPSTWRTTPYADQDIFDPTANANAAAWMWSVGRRNEWACQ